MQQAFLGKSKLPPPRTSGFRRLFLIFAFFWFPATSFGQVYSVQNISEKNDGDFLLASEINSIIKTISGILFDDSNAILEVAGTVKATDFIKSDGTAVGGSSFENIFEDGAKIGIGTTTPAAKLDVLGDLKTSQSVSSPAFYGNLRNQVLYRASRYNGTYIHGVENNGNPATSSNSSNYREMPPGVSTGVYSWWNYADSVGEPSSSYGSAIGFGHGTAGTTEIWGGWTNGQIWSRFLRDCCQGWSKWSRVDIPAGAVVAFNLTSCPSGWSEYTPARGRFIRGIDSSGSKNVDPSGKRSPGNVQNDTFGRHSHISPDPANSNRNNPYGTATKSRPSGANAEWALDRLDGPEVMVYNSFTGSTETRPRNVALLYCTKN